MRTKRQQWQFERLFRNVGQLGTAKHILYGLLYTSSTLLKEKKHITKALNHLDKVNFKNNKEESWKRFKKS